MKARQNIRKRQADEDEEDDDNHNNISVKNSSSLIQNHTNHRPLKKMMENIISTYDDDGDDNDDNSADNRDGIKSSIEFKKRKPIKKMRQAPGAADVIINLSSSDEVKESSSFGMDYSVESLRKLREDQSFKSKVEIKSEKYLERENDMDRTENKMEVDNRIGLEFTGEMADMIEDELSILGNKSVNVDNQNIDELKDEKLIEEMKLTTLLAKKKRRRGDGHEYGDDNDMDTDNYLYSTSFVDSLKDTISKAIEIPSRARKDSKHNSRVVSFAMENDQKEEEGEDKDDKDRYNKSISHSKSKVSLSKSNRIKEFIALDEDSSEWENEILRRAHISNTTSSSSSISHSKYNNSNSVNTNKTLDSMDFSMNVLDYIQTAISKASQILNVETPQKEKQLESFILDKENLIVKEKEYKQLLEIKVKEHNKVVEYADFIEGVTDILASKEDMISDLIKVYSNLLQSIGDKITTLRRQVTENSLYDMIVQCTVTNHPILSSSNILHSLDHNFIISKELSNAIIDLHSSDGSKQYQSNRFYDPSRKNLFSQLQSNSESKSSLQPHLLNYLKEECVGNSILERILFINHKYLSYGMMNDYFYYNSKDIHTEFNKFYTINQAADVVFEDVSNPDFITIEGILDIFEEFRMEMFEKYHRSFMSLSLPELLDPIIQLYLIRSLIFIQPYIDDDNNRNTNDDNIKNDNFHSNISSYLSQWKWIKQLRDFSLHSPNDKISVILSENDTDITLLPRVISKTLIPWLNIILTNVFDPLSIYHSHRCSIMLQDLVRYDLSSSNLSLLASTIAKRFDSSLSLLCVPIFKSQSMKKKPSRFAPISSPDLSLNSMNDVSSINNINSSSNQLSDQCNEYFVIQTLELIKWIGNLSFFQFLFSSKVIKGLVWNSLFKKVFSSIQTFLLQSSDKTYNIHSSPSIYEEADICTMLLLDAIFQLVPLSSFDPSDYNEMFKWNKIRDDVHTITNLFDLSNTNINISNEHHQYLLASHSKIVDLKEKIKQMSLSS